MPFCLFVCKKWTHAKLCRNDSNMILNSIFKAINTYSTILNYKIGIFGRNIFLYVRMQKKRTRAKLCTSESNMILYSIFKAINTYSTILNYKVGIFFCNNFLHELLQKVNSCKIVHKWFKHDLKLNI